MEDKYMMDNHKLLWHLERVNEWQRDEKIVPLHIDFGITTGCNMACKYCYGMIQQRTGKTKRYDMPRKVIFNFLRDAKDIGVKSVAFIGEGENTLNESLYDSLNYAKKIKLDVSLATNGIAIEKPKIKSLLEAVEWLRFNISAALPKTYSLMHSVPLEMFETTINNVKACVNIKRRYEIDVIIGIQMVVINENIIDIIPLAKLGKELGVDYLVIKPCSDTPDKKLNAPTDEYLDIEDILKEAESYSDENYIVSVKWSKIKNLGKKDYNVCYGTQFILGISGNGNVFPCGHWFNIRKDEFLMGSIVDSSFRNIIESKRYWDVQKKIQRVDVNNECESNCRQHYVNEFLSNIKTEPKHVNFI